MREVKLDNPIEFDGQRVEKLSIRSPKVKDNIQIQKMQGSDSEKEVAFIARLCNVPIELIEELEMSDYFKLQETLGVFLTKKRKL